MSHPATVHSPLTVPEAALLLKQLEEDVQNRDENPNSPGPASVPMRLVVARIAAAFRAGQFMQAGAWLVALNAGTVGVWPDEEPSGQYWWRGRRTDDALQMLAEAFAELTLGITTPYWEIDLSDGRSMA